MINSSLSNLPYQRPLSVTVLILGAILRVDSARSFASKPSFQANMTGPTANVNSDYGKPSSTQKFWDGVAEKYSESPIKDMLSYEKKLEITRRYFRPDMKVVEIGCGTGGTAILHAPYVKHIHATDISTKMIEIAKKKAKDAGVENVSFERASVDELHNDPGSADAVLGMSILHLLEDKEGAIRKVHNMLKPGGIFVTSTICISDMGVAPKLFLHTLIPIGKFFGLFPLTLRQFSKDGLKESIMKNGFDIEYEWRPEKDKAAFIVAKKQT